MAKTPDSSETISQFSQPLPAAVAKQDSVFLHQLPKMSEAEIYERLGYADAGKPGGLDKARQEFKADHPGLKPGDLDHGHPTMKKLEAVLKQAVADKEKFTRMGADGITVAQAYGITTGAGNAHVKPDSVVELAIAERAFDPTFTQKPTAADAPGDNQSRLQAPSRQPGLIQMDPNQWLETVRDFGGKYPGTQLAKLAEQMNKMLPPDSKGKRPGVDTLNDSHAGRALQSQVLALRDNATVAAEIGSEYAARNPVQLDIMKCYAGYTASDKGNEQQLTKLFQHMGLPADDASPQKVGQWCAAMANAAMSGAGEPGSNRYAHSAFTEDGTRGLRLAGDFANYGTSVTDPGKVKPGDVVVFGGADGSKDGDPWSHVAIVSHVDSSTNTFSFIGGNQGKSASVNEHSQSLSSADVDFRRPPPNAFATAQAQYAKTHKPATAPKPGTPTS